MFLKIKEITEENENTLVSEKNTTYISRERIQYNVLFIYLMTHRLKFHILDNIYERRRWYYHRKRGYDIISVICLNTDYFKYLRPLAIGSIVPLKYPTTNDNNSLKDQ